VGRDASPNKIEDYALIGDCETAALVSRRGSIDWLCLPRFDSPACFAALLGRPEHGRWLVTPRAKATVMRRYRPHTLILETEFKTASGKVTLIDFMPVRENTPRIIRMVRGDSGTVDLHMDLVMRFDYGLTVPWVTQEEEGILRAVAGPHRLLLHANVPMHGEQLRTVSDFCVKAGELVHFRMQYSNSFARVLPTLTPKAWLKKTDRLWRRWASRCEYRGPYADVVERSLLTLRALVYHPTGGMVAAPTTSLPEKPGGPLNWDYRYCWLRDATFTLLGLLHAGYHKEARKWRNWLVHAAAGSAEQVQILYGVTGERLLQERVVEWLPGFQNSRPVRIGNAASEQLQLDMYGEIADALFQDRATPRRDGLHFDLSFALLEHLKKIWREPDHGIWELRGKRQQFTHSKVMAWVAFDRTIRIAERYKLNAPLREWRAVRQQIHDEICKKGFNSKIGSFVQHYGAPEVDASLLLLPIVGFLPPNDRRISGTVRRIEKTLLRNGFVARFRTAPRGTLTKLHEGTFLPCTFWLADYYVLAGQRGKAEQILKRLLKVQNDVGLLAEEYDTHKKCQIGNFPQALTHVALVNTVINLYRVEGPARQRANHHRANPKSRNTGST
jgi:GH15 family glucan-1,4-alpha-glucosidase